MESRGLFYDYNERWRLDVLCRHNERVVVEFRAAKKQTCDSAGLARKMDDPLQKVVVHFYWGTRAFWI